LILLRYFIWSCIPLRTFLKYSSLCLISHIALLTTYGGEKGKCGTHNWSWEVVDISYYSVRININSYKQKIRHCQQIPFSTEETEILKRTIVMSKQSLLNALNCLAYLSHSLFFFTSITHEAMILKSLPTSVSHLQNWLFLLYVWEKNNFPTDTSGARGGAVGWGTALQTRR